MPNLFAVCGTSFLIAAGALLQQAPKPAAESQTAPEASKEVNPIKPTPASLTQAKKIYGYECEMCHGPDGSGKTDLAEQMKLKMRDLRDPASLKDVTDGELFNLIKNGKGGMPPEGDRVKRDDVWNLVNYVRSFAKKETPDAKKETPEKPKPDTP